MLSQQLELQKFYQATKNLGQNERYRTASASEMYFWGLQYANRRPWGDASVPIRERKPLIQVPLYRMAIGRLERLIWGGHRFPPAHIGATDVAGGAGDIGPIVTEAQSQELSRFLKACVDKGRLRQLAREYSRKAMVTGSAAVILGARAGYLTWHVEAGKDCTPTYDETGFGLKQLDILKQYEKEQPNGLGGLLKQRVWYRRVIDANRDVVFKEVPVTRFADPQWVEDPEKTVVHGFGFCPARWVKSLGDSDDAIDGRPVIDPTLHQAFEEFDYSWTLKNRAVQYGTDPQPVRRGVPEQAREDLAKSPGNAWDLPEPDQDIRFLEISGSGAQRAGEHIADLKQAILEAIDIVLTDPKHFSGDLSGPVLEMIHAPMIGLASDLRFDLGECAYVGILNLALRMVATLVARGEGLLIPGIRQAAGLIQASQKDGGWLDYAVQLQWPAFFPATITDRKAAIESATSARNAGAITHRRMVQALAPFFGIEDATAEAKQAAQELADAQARAVALQGLPVTPTSPSPAPPSPAAKDALAEAVEKADAAKPPTTTET